MCYSSLCARCKERCKKSLVIKKVAFSFLLLREYYYQISGGTDGGCINSSRIIKMEIKFARLEEGHFRVTTSLEMEK